MKLNFNELLDKEEDNNIILQDPTYTISINKNNNYIQGIYTTYKGDVVKVIFTSTKKETYSEVFPKYWEIIGEDYKLNLDHHLIILPPKIYWDLYKKRAYGKEFLKHTGIYSNALEVNGKRFTFPDTNYYFNGLKDNGGVVRGVYAIKLGEIILYIGSCSTDIIARWKQHVQCFLDRDPRNAMYTSVEDPTQLSFELLFSDEDINDMLPKKVIRVSTEMIQYTEQVLIKTYRPPFNIEGKTTPFVYRGGRSLSSIDTDYIEIIEDFLLNCKCETQEEIKCWFIKKYGEEIYNKLTKNNKC